MKDRYYQMNWKKASVTLGLSLGLLGSVGLYGPDILTAKAAEATEVNQNAQSTNTQEEVTHTTQEVENDSSNQSSQAPQENAETGQSADLDQPSQVAGSVESELDLAKSIAKDWVNSVEYVDRDEEGNPQAYSYTRNYQTHRINASELNTDTREDWAVRYIVDSQAKAEQAQYDQASVQLAESGIDANQIVDQDEDNYYVQVGDERQALPKSQVTEADATAIQQVLDYKEKEGLRRAYSQAPDFAQNEYLEGKIIYDGEPKYRSLHAYEDSPELNHYHHRPVSRYNETEQEALDHILDRNTKQLQEKYNQSLALAPNWAEEVSRTETDENGQTLNYIVDHGDHIHKMPAADLSPEQKEALDFVVKTNRDKRQQEVYQSTPEWTRHVDAKIVDRDGKVNYKTVDLDGNVAYQNADGLSNAQLDGIDFLLELEAERQAGVQRRSRERAKDYLPGLVRGIKDEQGDYVTFVYEDGRQVPASDIPRTPARALTRILNYQEEQDDLKLEQAEALAPIWAKDLIAKVQDDQGKVTYVQDHGDHNHYYDAASLSDQEREAVEYIVSAKNLPVENSLDQWTNQGHGHSQDHADDHSHEDTDQVVETDQTNLTDEEQVSQTDQTDLTDEEQIAKTPANGEETPPSKSQNDLDPAGSNQVQTQTINQEDSNERVQTSPQVSEIKPSPQADPAKTLPETGSNAWILAGLGLGLVSAGGNLLKRKED